MKKRQEFFSSTRYATAALASLLPMSFLLSCGGTTTKQTQATQAQQPAKMMHTHTHEREHSHTHDHAGEKKQEQRKVSTHSASGYAHSLIAKGQAELTFEAAKKELEAAKTFFVSLSEIPEKVVALHAMYEELKKVHYKIEKLSRILEGAEQDVVIAGKRNWRLGKEVMLYLFTLKFFWGMFTGYAPTTSTSEQVARLATVKEEVGKQLEEAKVEKQLLEGRFKKAIEALRVSYDSVLKKAFSSAFKNKVLSSKLAVVRVFEDLIRALQEEQQRKRMFREELRIQYPTTPYSVALSMPISDSEQMHYFTNFHKHKLQEATAELLTLERSLAHILSIVESPSYPLTKVSPTVLVAKAAEMVAAAETTLAQAVEDTEKAASTVDHLESHTEITGAYNSQQELIQEVATARSEARKQSEAAAAAATRTEQYFKAIETLRNSLSRVHSQLSSVIAIEEELEAASDLVVMREQALRKAARENYSLFRELGLYILGFKWLWGGKTGYAPTVSTATEAKALEEAREAMNANVKYRTDELTQLKSEFERSLTMVEENYKTLLSRSRTSEEVATLNRFYTKYRTVVKTFVRAMEVYADARELFLRDQTSHDLHEGFSFSAFMKSFGGATRSILSTISQVKPHVDTAESVVKSFIDSFEGPTPAALTSLGKQAVTFAGVKEQFNTFFKVVAGVIFDKLISPEQTVVEEEMDVEPQMAKKSETKE